MKLCFQCQHAFDDAGWTCPACGAAPPMRQGFTCCAPELAAEQVQYDPAFFELLSQAEQGHFWFEARNRLIQWALRRYCPQARSFLEVGCGTGYVLLGLARTRPDLKLVGGEAFAEGLTLAARRVPLATLLQMDAQRIPFREEFDAVAALDVLEHIVDDALVLRQMAQAARPGGIVLVTVPQHQWLWAPIDTAAGHQRRYQRPDLLAKAAQAGLRVERVTSFVSLLLPLMWAARLRSKRQVTDLMDEFRLGRTTNRCLGLVMGLEQALIRMGLGFPAGGSLLLVARKV